MILTKLKNHPFAVEAFFRQSIVLTFSVPKEQLEKMIPECLELDTFQDKYAFIAMAMVDTKALKPKGFKWFPGNDFFLIGYRIFVKYRTNAGKNLRGLYILKSETNKKVMEYLGSIFTKYDYSTTDIITQHRGDQFSISSAKSAFDIKIDMEQTEVELPKNSPFISWQEARRFAGPLPFTFSYNKTLKEVLIIQGVREDWLPKPLKVLSYEIGYLDTLGLEGLQLANAFVINNISYYWKKGKTEKWKG